MDEYLKRIEVRKIEENSETLSYRINHIDPSVLNALRRTIISDTQTVAIHWVYIRENETVMADEILAHRIGLIPVIAHPSIISPIEKNNIFNPDTDLTDENSIFMELAVENKTDKILSVYSDDIKIGSSKNIQLKSKVFITRLAPHKRIECRLYAILGTGRDHSKWMPTSVCYYRCIKQIELKDPSRAQEIKKYFRDGFSVDENGPQVDEDKLLVNMDVLKKHPDIVNIQTKEDSFLFEIETISESPKEIVKRGFAALRENLKELETAANRE
ncbi:DNA-directed RNA polymerases I and III subunit RPAC1 [Nematocida minor]|uniref:DNA-directed RNA polymerases I and III subunit RPAC1 n=1 Tax=Nematocida minor TaxID=1912983 RepID=UPI002220DA1B|nr:DNA-directed RNA polymerases I and III subunit RPAC1 [Nematocida minor]KAI5191071.1 DNA-directed RNA polymerases I and III subunit RPAC1 [Nematocida minor]